MRNSGFTIIEEVDGEDLHDFSEEAWTAFNASRGWTNDLFAGSSIYLVAKVPTDDGEEIIGYTRMDIGRGVAYVASTIIADEYRRLGHARDLMLGAEILAREDGCHMMWLKTSEVHTEALKFWESIGFTLAATLPNFELGLTWYIFTKEL